MTAFGWFVLGLFIGAAVGAIVVALCVASKRETP